MSKVEHQNATALSDDELRTLDAHWRAAIWPPDRSICWPTRC